MAENRQPLRLSHFQIRRGPGAITTPREADVIDLSLGGALVEHQGGLKVGGPCFLDLPTFGGILTIQCRVIHSRVSRRGPRGTLHYTTGVEFLDLTPEAEQILGAIIRSFGAPKD
jgi:hypothetical protein